MITFNVLEVQAVKISRSALPRIKNAMLMANEPATYGKYMIRATSRAL
jgi:hypothetical protein